jgi:hypothetical protein
MSIKPPECLIGWNQKSFNSAEVLKNKKTGAAVKEFRNSAPSGLPLDSR